ncbi:MAG: DedA family protein [Thaumarchaeota archaeon]|nr:DedA family protein [Nitrososphaerota archaeon]
MSISGTIYDFAINLMQSSGYLGVFILMAMESATLPIPSEVVLPFAGYYLVYLDHFDFWAVVAVASAGSLLGTLIDYAIGYYLGRAAVLRYGSLIRLNEGHLKVSEVWFARHGSKIVLFSRFVPLIRTLIAFPAGIAEMNIVKFVAFSAVGIFAWDAILVYAGVLAGQNYASVVASIQTYYGFAGILAILVTALVLIFFWWRRRRQISRKANTASG